MKFNEKAQVINSQDAWPRKSAMKPKPLPANPEVLVVDVEKEKAITDKTKVESPGGSEGPPRREVNLKPAPERAPGKGKGTLKNWRNKGKGGKGKGKAKAK